MANFVDSENVFLDEKGLASLLADGGILSKLKDNYESRAGQLELVRAICKCFNHNLMGVFEAGTGIGKSFAYLIPAITKARKEKSRVVISTATINLQNQLLEKDIPFVLKMLSLCAEDIKIALVKGRANYLCLRKLEEKISETQFLQQELGITILHNDKKDIGILYEWSQKTERGDREDLKEKIKEELWSELSSDAETCLASICPHFSKCFVAKMRQRAEDANIIVANHHVVFADIKIKMDDLEQRANEDDLADESDGQNKKINSILPSFKHIIFDEAHSIKKTAINFFAQQISKRELQHYLSILFIETNRRRKKGIITELSYILQEVNLKEFELLQNTLLETYGDLENFALNLLIESNQLDIKQIEKNKKNELLERFKKFYQAIVKLSRYISFVIEKIEDNDELKEKKHQLSLVLKKIVKIIDVASSFLKYEKIEDVVFWFEKKRIKNDEYEIIFLQTPLNVASILKAYLFNKMKTTISVSATLTIGKNFAYYLNGVGLRGDSFNIEKNNFPSPFLYEENVLLSVPQDMPLPSEKSFQDAVNTAVLSLIKATNGKALVLFTSYQSLITTSEYVKQNINEDIPVYAQGDDDRFRLLEAFKTDIEACLFATMSFWEGIDVPGEALSNLILVKLPFTVPSHPVTKARAEALEKRGFDPFVCMNIPEAIILFKQGFGRLIRTQQDRGVITVLDKRLITKSYGKMFLDSIPKTARCFATLKEIIYSINNFF